MDEVTQILIENYVRDLQKKDIDPFFRAKLLEQLMSEQQLSLRSFAKEYGIHHNTVEDWMLFNRITLSEYNTLKAKGLTHTDIYRILRNNRTEDIDWESEAIEVNNEKRAKERTELSKSSTKSSQNYIDIRLNQSIKEFNNIRVNLRKYTLTNETKPKVKELIDSLNRLLMYMEKK